MAKNNYGKFAQAFDWNTTFLTLVYNVSAMFSAGFTSTNLSKYIKL